VSVNYKLIANTIPEALMSLALASIGPDKQKTRTIVVDGVSVKAPMVDDNGDPVMTAGGFTDLIAVENAFDSIKVLSVLQSKNKYMQTYTGIADDVDFATSKSFSDSVKSAIAVDALPSWVDEALNSAGLNVNDPEVSNVLTLMVASLGLSQTVADAILETGFEDVKTFPSLKMGHVQNAIHKRHTGEI
jgi:hypothetical protein